MDANATVLLVILAGGLLLVVLTALYKWARLLYTTESWIGFVGLMAYFAYLLTNAIARAGNEPLEPSFALVGFLAGMVAIFGTSPALGKMAKPWWYVLGLFVPILNIYLLWSWSNQWRDGTWKIPKPFVERKAEEARNKILAENRIRKHLGKAPLPVPSVEESLKAVQEGPLSIYD